MIYISSSCIKGVSKICEAVRQLHDHGFNNIELSGGSNPYEGIENDLLSLKYDLGINLLCHNYFPPPPVAFVLNLASLDDTIHKMTMEHLKRAIDLSVRLGAKKYAFHAGFYTDVMLNEIGRSIGKRVLYNKEKCISKFCKSYEELQKYNNGRLELYIENNVIAQHNYENYDNSNFLMLTTHKEYTELKKQIDFKILLDVAHLYVSSETLNLPFQEEGKKLWEETDYIHISDNDARKDLNWALQNGSPIHELLTSSNKKGKTFTFEVYRSIDEIKESINLFEE
ncbi:MAG: TIM barrel protein [Bacteroidetes bacterium]|nr:TIM barrel protein [Bacteroidota bacterium]